MSAYPISYLGWWIIIRGSTLTGIGHHKRFRLSMASATLVKRSSFRADGERVLSEKWQDSGFVGSWFAFLIGGYR
jgi:hypothetical protein